jgi:hypothetical protein
MDSTAKTTSRAILFLIIAALLAGGLIATLMCWRVWQCADAIAVVAGGKTVNMSEWSRLHTSAAFLAGYTSIVLLVKRSTDLLPLIISMSSQTRFSVLQA